MTKTNGGRNGGDDDIPTIRVAVGSGNPCKIDSVRAAFESCFAGVARVEVTPCPDASSGVSDQPVGDEETKRGAENRALAALEIASSSSSSGTIDFGVGLEGGVVVDADDDRTALWCMAWMAVVGSDSDRCCSCRRDSGEDANERSSGDGSKRVWGRGRTGAFPLPPEICRLVTEEGMELGDADDKVFRRVNSKHGGGTVGILTKGMIDRAEYYDHALKLALVKWIHPDLYIFNQ